MNEDKIKGQWKQFIGKLKVKWGKLIDDDFQVVEGNCDYLVGKIQECYGIVCDEVEKQLKEFDCEL